MPLYEYYCSHCHTKFDALRPMKDADTPIQCEHCGSQRTARVLSVAFVSSGASQSGERATGGGCACGGACSCGHSHH
jgi:putative FmdB family regulatory protein